MKLYLLIVSLFNIILFASNQIEEVIDAGAAVNSLRQNNAVVGLLYFIVLVQAGIIVKLWLKVNQVSKERVEDLKERIKAEESLRRDIQDVYTKLNTNKNSKNG